MQSRIEHVYFPEGLILKINPSLIRSIQLLQNNKTTIYIIENMNRKKPEETCKWDNREGGDAPKEDYRDAPTLKFL